MTSLLRVEKAGVFKGVDDNNTGCEVLQTIEAMEKKFERVEQELFDKDLEENRIESGKINAIIHILGINEETTAAVIKKLEELKTSCEKIENDLGQLFAIEKKRCQRKVEKFKSICEILLERCQAMLSVELYMEQCHERVQRVALQYLCELYRVDARRNKAAAEEESKESELKAAKQGGKRFQVHQGDGAFQHLNLDRFPSMIAASSLLGEIDGQPVSKMNSKRSFREALEYLTEIERLKAIQALSSEAIYHLYSYFTPIHWYYLTQGQYAKIDPEKMPKIMECWSNLKTDFVSGSNVMELVVQRLPASIIYAIYQDFNPKEWGVLTEEQYSTLDPARMPQIAECWSKIGKDDRLGTNPDSRVPKLSAQLIYVLYEGFNICDWHCLTQEQYDSLDPIHMPNLAACWEKIKGSSSQSLIQKFSVNIIYAIYESFTSHHWQWLSKEQLGCLDLEKMPNLNEKCRQMIMKKK